MKLNRIKLINARNAKGLTQEEVAGQTELSIVTINKAEQGDNVYPKTAGKLASFYDIDLSQLMVPLKDDANGGNGDAA